MNRRLAAVLAPMTLGLALGLTACQGAPQRPPCPAGQVCLEYGNNTEPQTLDPQKANLVDESTVISDLMMGLTTDAADATPIPGGASSWEVSPDGLVWTFHLRDAAVVGRGAGDGRRLRLRPAAHARSEDRLDLRLPALQSSKAARR
jgi:oligopeptide transport system substrate-binding protein